jgi:hypothetical protein
MDLAMMIFLLQMDLAMAMPMAMPMAMAILRTAGYSPSLSKPPHMIDQSLLCLYSPHWQDMQQVRLRRSRFECER